MLKDLPKYIIYKLLFDLHVQDLMNIFKICKKFNDISNSSEFWRLKLMNDYQMYLDLKPKHLNYKQWYMRIINSGDLWQDDKIIAKDIYKYFIYSNKIFCIDMYNNLYFCNGSHINNKGYNINNFGKVWKTLNNKGYIKLLSNVSDFYIGSSFILILTVDNILYTSNVKVEKGKLIKKVTNVKKIICNDYWGRFLILLFNGDLFLNSSNTNTKIASNVKIAELDQCNKDIIYFIDNINQLHKYFIDCNYSRIKLNNVVFIKITKCCVLAITTDNIIHPTEYRYAYGYYMTFYEINEYLKDINPNNLKFRIDANLYGDKITLINENHQCYILDLCGTKVNNLPDQHSIIKCIMSQYYYYTKYRKEIVNWVDELPLTRISV